MYGSIQEIKRYASLTRYKQQVVYKICRGHGSTRKERGSLYYRTDPSRVTRVHPKAEPLMPQRTQHTHRRSQHEYDRGTLSYTSMSQRLLNSVVVLHRGSTNPSLTFPQPRAAFIMQSVALTWPPVRSLRRRSLMPRARFTTLFFHSRPSSSSFPSSFSFFTS